MKRLYQWVDWPGRTVSREGRHRDKSKFWNEGKWNTFIEPLIPEESLDLPFLEIGSNSGLFLKMAENKGFRKVIGVENSKDRIESAKLYREAIGGKYEIRHETMDSNYDWNKLPRFGLTLMANTHYYFPVVDFGEILANLRDRTLYCIIVGCKGRKMQGYAPHRMWRTKGYFNDWEYKGVVEKISNIGDPSPRDGMYGMVFKSNLRTIDLKEWQEEAVRVVGQSLDPKSRDILKPTKEFYDRIARGEEFDATDTPFCEYYKTRESDECARAHVVEKKKLAEDIKKNGIKKLVYISDKNMEDGFSRCMIASSLGYKKILAKYVGRV